MLKGAAAAGGGALALAALGGHLAAPVAAASPAIAAAQDELLPESKIVLGSAIAVSLTNHSVTLPLRQGVFNGQPTRNPNER